MDLYHLSTKQEQTSAHFIQCYPRSFWKKKLLTQHALAQLLRQCAVSPIQLLVYDKLYIQRGGHRIIHINMKSAAHAHSVTPSQVAASALHGQNYDLYYSIYMTSSSRRSSYYFSLSRHH
ncbi:hypothetical protein FGO68_gene12709 [Halteria grandinella]|uniref:Uncharacterized protein n=1 Tax=Halteria grandinella TaxID=5974 RepID=A0A8J8NDI9_HALGN|nr:hypothetical protein FGO68_gene12709 [Halteria grandinella]